MKWYQKTWVIVLLIIFCFPVGLFLLWRAPWEKSKKFKVIGGFIVFFTLAAFLPEEEPAPKNTNKNHPILEEVSELFIGETYSDKKVSDDEKALSQFAKDLDYKLSHTYSTQEDLENFDKYISQYKNDSGIGDTVYNTYVQYLKKADDGEKEYLMRGWDNELSKLRSIEQISFNNEQQEMLMQIEDVFVTLTEIKTAYDTPSICLNKKFNFSIHSQGMSLNAYAVKEEDSDIEGYRLILFTNYETAAGVEFPQYDKYYLVYVPDYFDIRQKGYNFSNLFVIGTQEMRGNFIYEVPVYYYTDNTDEYVAIIDYINVSEDRHYYRGYLSHLINLANGINDDEGGYWQ